MCENVEKQTHSFSRSYNTHPIQSRIDLKQCLNLHASGFQKYLMFSAILDVSGVILIYTWDTFWDALYILHISHDEPTFRAPSINFEILTDAGALDQRFMIQLSYTGGKSGL